MKKGKIRTGFLYLFLFTPYLYPSSSALLLETTEPALPYQNQTTANQTITVQYSNCALIDKSLIDTYSQVTLNYFINPELGLDSKTGLVNNYIIKKNGHITQSGYTSITDIGLQLASISGAYSTGMIPEDEAERMVEKIISTLNIMEAYQCSFGDYNECRYYFNYYDLNTLTSNKKFISSIDNAWLAAGLITARETFPELAEKINPIVEKMDFGLFYNSRRNLFRIGFFYNPKTDTLIDLSSIYNRTLYEIMNSETRMITYIAVGKGDISEKETLEHLQKLYKKPVEYNGIKVSPSSGGSAFEHGMPSLFVDETNLSPLGFGINLKKAFYIQILQAKELNYPIWGESPSTDEKYGYDVFGSPSGLKPYPSRGIVTPHASFLALQVLPQEAKKNLSNITLLYPDAFTEEAGFADAININNDEAITKYLALDQGMSFIAALNFTSGGIIQNIFMNSPEGQRISATMPEIKFFTPDELKQEAENCYLSGKEYIDNGNWQIGETLLNYAVDLSQSRIATDIELPDIPSYRIKIEWLKQTALSSLYRKADSLINAGEFSGAEKKLIQLLTIDRDYQDAYQKLEQIRRR